MKNTTITIPIPNYQSQIPQNGGQNIFALLHEKIIFTRTKERWQHKFYHMAQLFFFFQGAKTADRDLFKGLAKQKKWKRTSKRVEVMLPSFLISAPLGWLKFYLYAA